MYDMEQLRQLISKMDSKTRTLTIRMTPEVLSQLEKVALNSRRTKSSLAALAMARYVSTEAEIIDNVFAGAGDIKAGLTISHDAAMKRIRSTISALGKRQSK
jgi:predicted transcriptional regulator